MRHLPKRYADVLTARTTADPDAQEARVARMVRGRRQPGSGCGKRKGDVDMPTGAEFALDRFMIECKGTGKASLSVKGAWLEKITKEAMAEGKEPALQFEILGIDPSIAEQEWVAIPQSVFLRLLRLRSGTDR